MFDMLDQRRDLGRLKVGIHAKHDLSQFTHVLELSYVELDLICKHRCPKVLTVGRLGIGLQHRASSSFIFFTASSYISVEIKSSLRNSSKVNSSSSSICRIVEMDPKEFETVTRTKWVPRWQ